MNGLSHTFVPESFPVFASGHGFSRADTAENKLGFSPCGVFSDPPPCVNLKSNFRLATLVS